MARDSSRPVRRAILTLLKADADVLALVPAARIYPGSTPPVPDWPFIKWGRPTTVPVRADCVDGAEIVASVHAFAGPRLNGSGAAIETGEDHCARIGAAIARALDRQRPPLDGGYDATASIRWTGAQLLQDGSEADAWHSVQNFRVRVIS